MEVWISLFKAQIQVSDDWETHVFFSFLKKTQKQIQKKRLRRERCDLSESFLTTVPKTSSFGRVSRHVQPESAKGHWHIDIGSYFAMKTIVTASREPSIWSGRTSQDARRLMLGILSAKRRWILGRGGSWLIPSPLPFDPTSRYLPSSLWYSFLNGLVLPFGHSGCSFETFLCQTYHIRRMVDFSKTAFGSLELWGLNGSRSTRIVFTRLFPWCSDA